MVALTISLNIIQFALLAITLVGIGFFIRTRQLRKKQSRIFELENEMISNHAEILKLHQEISVLKQQIPENNANVPVVPLKQDPQAGDVSATLKKRAY
ncbi:MAG: hypothetical protein ACO1NW_12365 [Chitinophagaceae bacterium]